MNNQILAQEIKSSLPINLVGANREELRTYFENSWEIYEILFSAIDNDEDHYQSPDPLRNPLIFYYGHTAAFYVNKLRMAGVIDQGINEYYEDIFARGVDPDKAENLDVLDLWPSVDEVREYRMQVFNLVQVVIDGIDIPDRITDKSDVWSLLMGIEHDRIHFETSSVLFRQLDAEKLTRPMGWTYAPTYGSPFENKWLDVPEGNVELGKEDSSRLFGWDNEYGSKKFEVKAFKATKYLVSNYNYQKFVRDGFNNEEYWTEEGWAWKTEFDVQHPRFWIKDGEKYKYRAMFDVIDMPLDWPAEVNAYEAEAYCNWVGDGCRLMTEAEYNLIARKEMDREPFEQKYNTNLAFGSSTPIGYYTEETELGFADLWGNVWEWLSDDFYPLDGFETHYLYEDFSAPYMDNQHAMMLGGSWATTGTGASKDYRLWFRRHFYQHAGFRLAKDI